MSVILAHRGASGHAPENTLEAFRLAIQMGADGFELDVHMSRDGELVVIHDETLERTTNGTGFVRDHTLAELQSLDASCGMEAFRGAKIPTLAQVFQLVQDTHHIVNVEIKTDEYFYPGIEPACVELARRMGVENRVIYSSFNHFTLLRLREIAPEAKLGMLLGDILLKPWEYARALQVDYLHPMKMNIYVPDFVEHARQAGYGVNMWTINDPETLALCLEKDVGIITNYPDLAISLDNRRN